MNDPNNSNPVFHEDHTGDRYNAYLLICNSSWNANPNVATVSLAELEDALVRLFKPGDDQYPDTALFYFSGHGLRKQHPGVEKPDESNGSRPVLQTSCAGDCPA
jgi:hypothetical protein